MNKDGQFKKYENLRNKKIAFDIETTGLNYDDEILQISICDEDMNVIFDSLLKPTRHRKWIDAEQINNISPEMVKNAPKLSDVKSELISIFDNCQGVVGYNHTRFDVPFLERELDYKIQKPLYDVMYMYADFLHKEKPYEKYSFQKLTHLIDKLGFKKSEFYPSDRYAHDSCYDTLATMFGYNELNKNMELSSNKKINSQEEFKPIDMPVDELLTSLENNSSLSRKFQKGKELFLEFNFNDFSISSNANVDEYKVKYNNKYQQTIIFDDRNNVKELSCTCPDCQGGSQYCKHLIGSLLDIKERRNSMDYDSCTMDSKFIKSGLIKGIDSINRMPLDYYYSSNSLETTESISYKANLLPDDFVWNTYSDGSGGLYKGKQNYASYDFITGEYTIKTDSRKSYRYFDSMNEMMSDVENMIDKIFVNNKEYLQDKVNSEIKEGKIDFTPRPYTTPRADMDKGLKK